ncbi:MAG TPA: hypothetical protein VFJ94_14615 [Intrasporangium sp.]|uniref:hypothetical protein n=1 Tax=Intrasporangium sp. TaxID=1925024 RepID=UPI002D7905E3|nr:hypothetical protein [Intrasporangium sp.]HET7399747.1 hypothetical protein [Intrasporangium sp.]
MEPIITATLESVDRAMEARVPFYRRFGVWFPVLVYAVSRLLVWVAGSVLSHDQMALHLGQELIRITYPQAADPGYLSVMTNWDGQWYRIIAERGYPEVLPRTATGRVDMNPWAFYPVFPVTVGVVMRLTGLPFVVVGPILSMLIGVAAILMLFKLVDEAVGRWEAVVAVVATCFYVASPIFSASYTESTALLLVTLTLWLLRRRRYGWVVVSLLVLSLSRNVVIAMVPVILAHAVVRWRTGDEGPHPIRLRVGLAALAAYAGMLTWLWPTIASAVTGTPDAYNETMLAWKIQTKIKLYMWWNLLYDYGGVATQVLGVLGVAAFTWFMLTRHSWRWGPEIWGWAGAYPAYIVLVSSTTPSRVRYALLAFPMTLLIAWFLTLGPWRRWRYWALGGIVGVGGVLMWWYTATYIVIDQLVARPLLYP